MFETAYFPQSQSLKTASVLASFGDESAGLRSPIGSGAPWGREKIRHSYMARIKLWARFSTIRQIFSTAAVSPDGLVVFVETTALQELA
jgi:hypothetical protein